MPNRVQWRQPEVFPAEFPQRELDGRPVTTYEDFLAYLARKHPAIRRAELDLPGRSTVLYFDPRV